MSESKANPRMIGISGGKGGTGKTFVATNVAVALAKDNKVLLVDTDVENPNVPILLGLELGKPIDVIKCFFPKINADTCSKCGKCAQTCRFHALFHVTDKVPILIESLCKSCELCMRICPEDAIEREDKPIGEVFFLKKNENLDVLVGRLFPGSAKSTILIISLKEIAQKFIKEKNIYDYVIVDTAPGAHCDVEHSLSDVDKVICVTEPTPLGKHDLDRILQLTGFVHKPAEIIINRYDMAEYKKDMEDFAKEKNVPIISRIPLSRDVMETYARGVPIMSQSEHYGEDHPVIKEFLKIIGGLKE
ncbi:MAG: nucleotide-binding protein [Promethearchaeota archaeon]